MAVPHSSECKGQRAAPAMRAARVTLWAALAAEGDDGGARAAYEEALALREQLGERNRALEPRGGLAALALAAGDGWADALLQEGRAFVRARAALLGEREALFWQLPLHVALMGDG